MKKVDALIVGAGPAGSAAAIGLARRGFEVALLDKQRFPRDKLCGDFLNPAGRPILRELGVEGQVLGEPHGTITKFRITSCSGREAEVEFAGNGEVEPAIAMRRARLDEILMQRAAAVGVQVYPGRRIDRLDHQTGGWRIGAGEEEWHAATMIGADGRNSWVARRLGLASSIPAAGRAVGFQLRVETSDALDGGIEIHLIRGGYAGVVGLGDGTLNLAMAIDKRRLARQRDPEFLCERTLGANPHLRSLLQRRRSVTELRSAYPVHFPARRSVARRALLVGDAARVTEPVTGEGVYFALRSGLLAAETIDRALRRGDLSSSGLAGYDRACRRAFHKRAVLNALIRGAIYRPALLEPLIRFSAHHRTLLRSMVAAVCAA